MSYRPIIPAGGQAGWSFLTRTLETQQAAMRTSPVVQRDMTYFREAIGQVETAEDLVGDFTLLKVALGAFGLQEDLPNKYFVRTVLAEGVSEPGSLANRLNDPRYAALSKAFGFGGTGAPRTGLPGFADEILSAYNEQTFEVAVGEERGDMRLALGLERELGRVLEGAVSANARWYGVMGSPPLREVFETALGLPESFAALDIDQQLTVFRDRSEAIFGLREVADLAEPGALDRLRSRFLLMSDLAGGGTPSSSGASVLTLLQGGNGTPGPASILATLYGQ